MNLRRRVDPSSPSPRPPSGSHQHLTQEGAAAPCWGAGEWILFCPGASETTIPQCAALYWTPLWCGASRPTLSWMYSGGGGGGGGGGMGPGAHTPAQTSTEQPHIPDVCACQEALGTERKERGESHSHWRLPSGVVQSPSFRLLFTMMQRKLHLITENTALSSEFSINFNFSGFAKVKNKLKINK